MTLPSSTHITMSPDSAVKGDLAKYLRGTPQTAELEALASGEYDAEEHPIEVTQSLGARVREAKDWEPTDDDREHLRRLRVEPGWQIFLRLLDKDIRAQEDSVRGISEQDPLGNRDKIAEGWAYVAMLKRARERMVMSLDSQVKMLEEHERSARTTAQ